MNFKDNLDRAFDDNLNESVDRHKVISWISHNPALRLNKTGGLHPNERFNNFSIAVSKQDIAANTPPIVVGQRHDLESDELQRALTHFKQLGVEDEIPAPEEEDVSDFMSSASFYALASAKEGNIVYGIAVYSMDDPRYQDTEDDDFGDDKELFGVSPDTIRRIWDT